MGPHSLLVICLHDFLNYWTVNSDLFKSHSNIFDCLYYTRPTNTKTNSHRMDHRVFLKHKLNMVNIINAKEKLHFIKIKKQNFIYFHQNNINANEYAKYNLNYFCLSVLGQRFSEDCKSMGKQVPKTT